MSIYNQLFGKPDTSNSIQKLSLFKDDNENGGLFVKANFIPDLKAAGEKHQGFIAHTSKLINLMHDKRFFANEPNEGFEHGISVTWVHFRYGKINTRLCVPNIRGMAELIENYQNNRITVNVTFDELLEQAIGQVD